MKMVKIILLIVVLIVAIPLIIALFVDKNYSVRREIVINKARQEVFNYLKFLKNQEKYSKWVMMDP
ncbi:MAG TPA: polyketide cyclase, partial [Pedobacter sp.]